MSRHLLRPGLRHALRLPVPAAAGAAWTPLDLSSTLKGWWDFSDASTLYTDAGTTLVSADGQAIYQANDKSGNDWHLVQATAAARPLYKTAIVNSLSVSRFVSSDTLATATNHPLSGAQHYNLTIVTQATDAAANHGWFFGGTTPSNTLLALFWDTTRAVRLAWIDNDLNTAAAAITLNTWYIIMTEWDGTTQRTYINGGTPAQRAATGKNTAASAWTLGYFGSNAWYCVGDVADHLLCNDDLSVANKNLLGNHLADKYGLTWTTIT